MGYNSKHARETNNTGMKKSAVLLAALMLIFTVSVGATLAYVIDKDGPITNIFKPSHVACEVTEDAFTSTSTEKDNVQIKNTGDTTAWIRAEVIFTWKNTEGQVLGEAVGTDDYTITWKKENWLDGNDGYYYYKYPVTPGASTKQLFTDCKPVTANVPADYNLSVEIIAEAIQSKPASVFNDFWSASSGLTASGTEISAN